MPEIPGRLITYCSNIHPGESWRETFAALRQHIPLIKAGIPTIDLIDFDYKPWHTIGDTADKCSAESLGKIGKGLEAWLLKSPPFKPRAASNGGQR